MGRILVFLLLLAGIAGTPANADVTILVDEVHGLAAAADLAALLPQCDITALTAADFPITTMLASGVISEPTATIVFTVPPGAPTLYGRFVYDGAGLQLPFVHLQGPGGTTVAEQCNGSLHVEDPLPGEYTLLYDTWEPLTTSYELGIGPYLITAESCAGYDLVCSLWDDTYFLFVGPIPDYSAREEEVLSGFVASGGGYLYLREPLVAIAMKPIVNLYAARDVRCDVSLLFPGGLTYAEPPCTTVAEPAGTACLWHDVAIPAAGRAQILYEGKLARQTDWLQIVPAGDVVAVCNRTPYPLGEVTLLRRDGPDDWRLLRFASIPALATVTAPTAERLDRAALAARLTEVLRQGGQAAGLYPEEIETFIAHYRWEQRWLAEAEAEADGDWRALYRLSSAAYDAFIPRREELQTAQAVRTMWVWAGGLGTERGPAPRQTEIAQEVPATATAADRRADANRDPGALVYHEYGVLWQRADGNNEPARTPGFLSWEFYDEASLFDPVENWLGDPQRILFSRPGGHPDAETILTGAPEMLGLVSGAVTAPWTEQLLTGGEHCHTADDYYPPGSFPPVAVAGNLGAGRLAAIADRDFLTPEPYNPQFIANLVTWLAGQSTAVPDVPTPSARIVAVAPNPFNPRTTVTFAVARRGALDIAVYDVTGRRVAELAHGFYEAGIHTATWDGCDQASQAVPSGLYLVRLTAAGAEQSRKLLLIR